MSEGVPVEKLPVGDNIADIEAVVASAETGEQGKAEELPEAPKAVEVDPMEKARTKARNIVGALHGVFKFADKRIDYPERVYQEAETRLAPALAKHQLEESAVLKYSEEADAAAFLGNLIWKSASDLVGLKRADAAVKAAQAAAAEKASEDTIQRGVRPDGDES